MRSKMGRVAICVVGFALMILFQNFTYDQGRGAEQAIFGKGGERTALQRVKRVDPEASRLRGLAAQASGYADFVGVEDVTRMTDAEILSRVSDSMFTSLEVMKMENTQAGRVQSVESVARALEKDSRLQRMVITAVRDNANRIR